MIGTQPFPRREYAGYFRGHTGLLAGIAIAGVAQSFSNLPLAWLVRSFFDEVLPSHRSSALWLTIAGLLAVQIAALLLSYWIRIAALRVNQDMLARLRRGALERLYDLPRSFYTEADAGRLHVTLVQETPWIEAMNNALTVQFLPALLSAATLFTILLWLDPRYACILGVAAPALFVVNRMMTRRSWFRLERVRLAFESFSSGVRFLLAAMELTRAQAAETVELKRQNARITQLERLSLDLNRGDTAQQLAQRGLLLACTLAVLLAGGYAAAQGKMTRGETMAFYVVAALFASQAQIMVSAVPEIRMGMRAFAQLQALIALPDREPYRGRLPLTHAGDIQLEGVTFAYPAGRLILDGVTLRIPRGRRVGLIGANGSGKTTMAQLIAGHYRPHEGRLAADGHPFDELDIRSLRKRIAIVPQNPFLFSGSVRENVAYGSEQATEDAMWEALELAGADRFVKELPHQMETTIGELGVRLSGGQRQRLVIARALLRKPDLLILDEPSTHLDEEAITCLIDTIENLPLRPSVLLISHDLRLLQLVQDAYRLVDGKLQGLAPGAEVFI